MTAEWHNLDLMGDEYKSLLSRVSESRPDFGYSDPPWGEGNLKFWRTYNHNGVPATYADFVGRFIGLMKFVQRDIFLEMGLRWEDQWVEAFKQTGASIYDKWTLVYGSGKRPNVLLRFGYSELPKWSGPDLNGLTGWNASYQALKAVYSPSDVQLVLEPCVGKGLVAKSCKKLGLSLLANEINPDRLAIAKSAWDKS